MSTTYQSARIVSTSGMGGFLNPPGHPEHTMHVEIDLRRKPENRGGMSLSAAAKCETLDPKFRNKVKDILSNWLMTKLPETDPEVVKWVQSTLAYFKGCYEGDSGHGEARWNVDKLNIDQTIDPMENAHRHAGVRHIRQFYGLFVPTAEDFTARTWGDKVTVDQPELGSKQ
jgi:hypothetical protein